MRISESSVDMAAIGVLKSRLSRHIIARAAHAKLCRESCAGRNVLGRPQRAAGIEEYFMPNVLKRWREAYGGELLRNIFFLSSVGISMYILHRNIGPGLIIAGISSASSINAAFNAQLSAAKTPFLSSAKHEACSRHDSDGGISRPKTISRYQ